MSCELPVIDPFHPSVMQFISETTDPECPGNPHGELVNGVLKITGKLRRHIQRQMNRGGRNGVGA